MSTVLIACLIVIVAVAFFRFFLHKKEKIITSADPGIASSAEKAVAPVEVAVAEEIALEDEKTEGDIEAQADAIVDTLGWR